MPNNTTYVNNFYLINNRNLNIFAGIVLGSKKKKKLISIYGCLAELNRCLFLNKQICLYFYSRYITSLLCLLHTKLIINNYYLLTKREPRIKFRTFFQPLYIIFINTYFINVYKKNALLHIQLVSKPRRHVYISYKKLLILTSHKHSTTYYILNTSKGLMIDQTALQQRQGGQLLCKIV